MGKQNKKITHADVRMYRMGTGDCFIVKFFSEDDEQFKMMIDCGTWSGSAKKLTPYMQDLKQYVGDKVDLLIVTHEHKDHVHVFDACSNLFNKNSQFSADKIWMSWAEEDSNSKVQRWKTEHGEKKKALAMAAANFNIIYNTKTARNALKQTFNGLANIHYRSLFGKALSQFTDLHVGAKQYVGPLKGMEVAKKAIKNNGIEYHKPGTVIGNVPKLNGVKFYILGPPENWNQVKTESGGKGTGETYDNNSDLAKDNAFAAAVINYGKNTPSDLLPFDSSAVQNQSQTITYGAPSNEWRRIDHDWLNSAGMLAMRMNSLTNNLSLAIAIEFEDSGRVMLFPGDAEYGSWNSWHGIPWSKTGKNKKHLTEDLLNRTVFYKVAHHMSHNGTARKKGLDMMIDPDLMAMATLDYDVIAPGWTGTMPNAGIVKELIDKTKGRLIIMNDTKLKMDPRKKDLVSAKITEARARMSQKEAQQFNNSFKVGPGTNPMYYQVTIQG